MGGDGFWLGTHQLIVSPYVDAAMAQLGRRPVGRPTAGATKTQPTQIAYYCDPDGKAVYLCFGLQKWL